MFLKLDEPTLKAIAQMTQGDYYHAGTAETLKQVYEKMGTRLQVETRETEVSGLLALAAGMLLVMAACLSLLWFRRL